MRPRNPTIRCGDKCTHRGLFGKTLTTPVDSELIGCEFEYQNSCRKKKKCFFFLGHFVFCVFNVIIQNVSNLNWQSSLHLHCLARLTIDRTYSYTRCLLRNINYASLAQTSLLDTLSKQNKTLQLISRNCSNRTQRE